MIINSLLDIKRYVSSMLESYDMTQYVFSANALDICVAEDLRDLLKATGFVYGDKMPDISDEEWNILLKPYEKE